MNDTIERTLVARIEQLEREDNEKNKAAVRMERRIRELERALENVLCVYPAGLVDEHGRAERVLRDQRWQHE